MKRSALFVLIICAVLLSNLAAVLVVMHAQAVYIGVTLGCLTVAVFALWKLFRARNEKPVEDFITTPAPLTLAPTEVERGHTARQSPGSDEPKIEKGLFYCYIAFGALLLLYFVLGPLDNSTELSRSHDDVLLACLGVAGLTLLVCAVVAIHKSKNNTVWQRVRLVFSLGLFGLISVALVTMRAASIIEGRIDFPPGKTTSQIALISISRAYRTHGKGQSWKIQTTPVWSDLDITEADYDFMMTHRRAGDDSHNADEISSNGYFCARVTIQQSGNALRVMNAGSRTLPAGTVVICPPTSGLSSRQ